MDIAHMSSQEIDAPADQITGRSSVGVLLVHGLNGGRGDMEELAAFLAAHRLLTENLLLPGHGTDVRDMLPIGWPQWAQAVQSQLQQLKKRCAQVFLVGHSLVVRYACTPLHMKMLMVW